MAGGQGTGGGGDAGSTSYEDRGADNIEDLTRHDENQMDRAAQAGMSGAFGAGTDSDAAPESMRTDAEAAFGGTVEEGGGQTGSAGGGSGSSS